jgi:uroporphyrinogen decarboxylase
MAYMVEGGGSKTFSKPRKMLYEQPELAHQLLEKITQSTIAYLNAQVDAGAGLVQLFDSWAGVLSPDLYKTFCIPYIARICQALAPRVPVTVFALGASFAFPEISQTGCRVVGIDWHTAPDMARKLCGHEVTLQGNLDPACLYASEEVIRQQTRRMIDRFGPDRYIVNLGHGLYPDLDPGKVRVFVDEVKQWNSK